MEETELSLLLNYPLMSRNVKENAVTYRGTIQIDDEDYQIVITESENKSFTLDLPEKLAPLQTELHAVINDLHPKNILSVLDALRFFLASNTPSNSPVNLCDVYRHVLYEYSEFSKFYLNLKSHYLSQDLSNITISMVDERKREHSIEMSVNFYDQERIFQIQTFDLPQDKELFKASSNMRVLYDQFLGAVDALQPFFDLMDNFDKNCWILDPLECRRDCTFRRIKIGENLSVQIAVDPSNVSRIPDIKFLGPERLVELYRTTVNENLENWNPENDICSELLKLLGMDTFPRRPTDYERDETYILKESGDCSICFSLRLNDKLPEVVCKNKFCENYYHAECLYEWLMSVNARRFFTEIVGQCPNCEKNISCPIPK